jgi:hypothetical protein
MSDDGSRPAPIIPYALACALDDMPTAREALATVVRLADADRIALDNIRELRAALRRSAMWSRSWRRPAFSSQKKL